MACIMGSQWGKDSGDRECLYMYMAFYNETNLNRMMGKRLGLCASKISGTKKTSLLASTYLLRDLCSA